MMNITENFLATTNKMFRYYKSLADTAIERLSGEEIHFTPSDESNSVAVIVKHMSGNMQSRFTDFLTSDGEKDWRKRDDEFVDTFSSKKQMLEAWDKGWTCLFDTLGQIRETHLTNTVFIRKEPHTVLDALTRQIAHYAYHTGQIVYIAKALKKEGWESLSIPRGQSKDFNKPFLK
jgi:uncharacterized damage-inducible protein DinB